MAEHGRLLWTGAGQNLPQPFGKLVPSTQPTSLASSPLWPTEDYVDIVQGIQPDACPVRRRAPGLK